VTTPHQPATTFAEQLAAAKHSPAQGFSARELLHIIQAATDHARTCECNISPVRHAAHSAAPLTRRVHATLYHLGLRPDRGDR